MPPVPYQTAMATKASPSQALASWQGQPELGEKGPTLPDRTSTGGVKSRLLLLPSGQLCLASRAVYQAGEDENEAGWEVTCPLVSATREDGSRRSGSPDNSFTQRAARHRNRGLPFSKGDSWEHSRHSLRSGPVRFHSRNWNRKPGVERQLSPGPLSNKDVVRYSSTQQFLQNRLGGNRSVIRHLTVAIHSLLGNRLETTQKIK